MQINQEQVITWRVLTPRSLKLTKRI